MPKFKFINLNQLLIDSLPPILRTPKRIAYLKTLIHPLVNKYNFLLEYRKDVLNLLGHTGQLNSIAHTLNTRIDIVGQPITIELGTSYPTYYISPVGTPKTNILAEYQRNNVNYTYNPTEMWIGDNTEPIDDKTLWINHTYDGSPTTFFIYVDPIDYDDPKKIELINYYTKLYLQVGSQLIIKKY